MSRWSAGFAHERQAQAAANGRSVLGRRGAIRHESAPWEQGPGRPLPERERARAEKKFGRDFSGVRVHADSRTADEIGAKAFAYGRDLVFGPGQYKPQLPEGRGLLDHELAHLGQQADHGAAAIQKQGKERARGIGSAPPSVDFQKATDVGPEDSSITFALDKADLSAATRKTLMDAIAGHKGPVTVQIHGYASSEGQGPDMGEYNFNLSAHRAAAVKAFLEAKLPGSKFILFAHGETTAFAPLDQNRRAGIAIKDGVAAPEEARHKNAEQSKTGQEKEEEKRKTLVFLYPPITLDRSAASPYAPYRPLAPYAAGVPGLIPPLVTPPVYGDIDWEGLHNKAADRGMRLDGPLGDSLSQHFFYSYNFFFPLLGKDWSITASNLATNFMFDSWLQQNQPNAFDRAQNEFKIAYPNEHHLVIPFLSSDVLDQIWMKIKGEKKDDYFFRF